MSQDVECAVNPLLLFHVRSCLPRVVGSRRPRVAGVCLGVMVAKVVTRMSVRVEECGSRTCGGKKNIGKRKARKRKKNVTEYGFGPIKGVTKQW